LLCICVLAGFFSPSQGIQLLLLREPSSSNCGDGRPIVLHNEPDGSWWINQDKLRPAKIPEAVAQIMESRAERAVYLIPREKSSMQEIAGLTANLEAATPDLHIGIVTHNQIQSMTRHDHGLQWVPITCMSWPL
jgi:biopolymer transport protein ExbD